MANGKHQVIVSGKGMVYDGDVRREAINYYDAYRVMVDTPSHEHAGECVTLQFNGEIIMQHIGVAPTTLAAALSILSEIQSQLDGVEWSADTLDTIANILRQNGYSVADSADND